MRSGVSQATLTSESVTCQITRDNVKLEVFVLSLRYNHRTLKKLLVTLLIILRINNNQYAMHLENKGNSMI